MPHDFWLRGLPRVVTAPATALWFNLQVAATRFPDKAAYIYCGAALSFGDMNRQASCVAGWLGQEAGIRRGERVLLMGQTSPQFATAVYGVLLANAVVVPANPMYVTDEVAHLLEDSGARTVIVAQELYERLVPLLGKLIDKMLMFAYSDAIDPDQAAWAPDWTRAPMRRFANLQGAHWADVVNMEWQPSEPVTGPDDTAAIVYTSGTTGRPKGVIHTHRTLFAGAIAAPTWRGDRADTVIMAAAPMTHMMALQGQVVANVFMTSTVVLLPRWDVRGALTLIERHRVNHWSVAPAMLLDVMGQHDLDRFDLSSLRTISGGGAALPATVSRRLTQDLDVRYIEVWGMTETAATLMMNPPERTKPQCLGIPTFGAQAQIRDPITKTPVAQGEIGELWVTGPQLMQGYWNNPSATQEALHDIDGVRWLRTGDLARCDDEGYYFMTDRIKRMINVSGYKVWPAEVEAMLHEHPAIQEACVVGVGDPRRGESVRALIVLRASEATSTSESELLDWARTRMAVYKCPRSIKFVPQLLRSPTGKIDWRRLQDAERAQHTTVEP